MRKLAICLVLFWTAIWSRAAVPPRSGPPDLWSRIEADRFRREEILYHWQMAAGLAAFNSADKQGMKDWLRLANMPLVAPDETGLHPLEGEACGGTRFMVVLPEDMQYFDPETRAAIARTTVGYLRTPDILVVTEDIDVRNWRVGFYLLLYTMESSLPRDFVTTPHSRELAEWEIQTEGRLKKELAGD